MAYFNHAFQKSFLCTGTAATTGKTVDLTYSTGAGAGYGFFNPTTWAALPLNTVFDNDCCPLIFASASFLGSDKIGPFHGGYKETNKSKIINPKYVSKIYEVAPCNAQQAQITVGSTVETFETATCNKDFICGETYYLRLDIKGSPVLQYLTRNTYFNADAYTGCCADDAAPTAVNPLIVYANWAYNLLNSPLIAPFINIQVTYSLNAGVDWLQLAPGTNVVADDTSSLETLLGFINNPSTLPGDNTTLAGLIITGAYVDTRFGDCTFYPSDSTIAFMEPVRMYASEVDLNGDPCAFTGLCVNQVCEPVQLSGTGEHVLRDMILSESYRQNMFSTHSDLRIREITQGDDFLTAISRTGSYHKFYIQHNVPYFNNPSGVFDNQQYLLELVFNAADTAKITAMRTFLNNWLGCANNCLEVETFSCPAVCTKTPAVFEEE